MYILYLYIPLDLNLSHVYTQLCVTYTCTYVRYTNVGRKTTPIMSQVSMYDIHPHTIRGKRSPIRLHTAI